MSWNILPKNVLQYFLTKLKVLMYTKTEVDNLIPDSLSDLSDDSTHRLVTDTEKTAWSNKSVVSANPQSTTGTLSGLEIDGIGFSIPSGGHAIKNDSGTTLANKNNLKFAGTYSANVGDDTVVNITREMTLAEFNQLSADEKKGFIDTIDEPDDTLSDVAVTGEYSDILNRPIMGENTFKVTREQSQSTAVPGYWACMVHPNAAGNPTTPGNGWWHVISMDWAGTSTTNWISQLALATQDNNGVWYRKTAADTDIDTRPWTRLADADANGYANVANLLNGFINACGADNSGSNTFTYDFLANRMYIVTLGGVGGGGARFLNGSVYLVWCNENNTTGSLVTSPIRAGSYSISSTARAQTGTNKFTLTANTAVRWNVYPFLLG